MSKFFNAVLLGIIVGVAAYWFVEKKARQHPEAEQRYEQSAARAREAGTETAHQLSDAFKAKLETLNLGTEEIKDELARTGRIVRRRAQDLGEQVKDAAVDARIVATIKAKYLADGELSAWKISVACDQGHVTLSGIVSAPENIGKAVALALETEGVRDVTSSLNVRPNA
jgi:osmotically-inducible protein OsmY